MLDSEREKSTRSGCEFCRSRQLGLPGQVRESVFHPLDNRSYWKVLSRGWLHLKVTVLLSQGLHASGVTTVPETRGGTVGMREDGGVERQRRGKNGKIWWLMAFGGEEGVAKFQPLSQLRGKCVGSRLCLLWEGLCEFAGWFHVTDQVVISREFSLVMLILLSNTFDG